MPGGAYLFHGEEEFVKDSALNALIHSIDDASRDLNVQIFESPSADELISACETLPFFAERRLVICHALPSDNEGQALKQYIPSMPSTTVLVFFLRGKAKETSALYRCMAADNRCVNFTPLPPLEAEKWVTQQAAKLGVTISPAAARYIVSLVGTNLTDLNNEFTKAACYAGTGNEVTKEAISACVTRNLEFRVFDMMEYFLAGKPQDGLRAYQQMLFDGESPFKMAALLENRFKLMLAARTDMDSGVKRDKTLNRMGNTYPAKKAYGSALRYHRDEITGNLARFASVGYLQVSGQQTDADALECALILCMPARR